MRMGLLLGQVLLALPWVTGCATLSRPVSPPLHRSGEGHHYVEGVPPVAQKAYRCGPAALESVYRYWGKEASADEIGAELRFRGKRGVLNIALARHAESQDFWTETSPADAEALKRRIREGLPPVALVRAAPFWLPVYHFVVLTGFDDARRIFYANTGEPSVQAIPYGRFQKRWESAGRWCLVICPPSRVDWDLPWEQAARLAFLLERTGQPAEAEARYRRALEQEPGHPMIRFNLANLYLKTGRLEETEGLYRELLAARPDWTEAANNLAWVLVEKGAHREAIQILEGALEAGALRNHELLDTLGVAHRRAGRPEAAEGYFREALAKVPPEDAQARRLIEAHQREASF